MRQQLDGLCGLLEHSALKLGVDALLGGKLLLHHRHLRVQPCHLLVAARYTARRELPLQRLDDARRLLEQSECLLECGAIPLERSVTFQQLPHRVGRECLCLLRFLCQAQSSL